METAKYQPKPEVIPVFRDYLRDINQGFMEPDYTEETESYALNAWFIYDGSVSRFYTICWVARDEGSAWWSGDYNESQLPKPCLTDGDQDNIDVLINSSTERHPNFQGIETYIGVRVAPNKDRIEPFLFPGISGPSRARLARLGRKEGSHPKSVGQTSKALVRVNSFTGIRP